MQSGEPMGPTYSFSASDIQWEQLPDFCGGFYFLYTAPTELAELSDEDAAFYKRCEFEAIFSVRFTQPTPGVYRAEKNGSPTQPDEILIDCQDDLCLVCAFGKLSVLKKFLEHCADKADIDIIPFTNDILIDTAATCENLIRFTYDFSSEAIQQPGRCKNAGTVEGDIAGQVFKNLRTNHLRIFCLVSFSAYLNQTSICALSLESNGLFLLQDFDPVSLSENIRCIDRIIRRKVDYLFQTVRKPVSVDSGDYSVIEGCNPIFDISPKTADILLFYKKLLRAEASMGCKVFQAEAFQFDRRFRFISLKNAASFDVVMNAGAISILLHDASAVVLAMRFEYFIHKHLNAGVLFYAA